jgi:cell division protein FtsL
MPNTKKNPPNGITFGMFAVILMSMAIVLILASVKIYLANQIYYQSKVVNKVQQEVSTLKIEKIMLEENVESLTFKHRVTDTIFTIQAND